jgi:predicted Zn-dependent peptidase
MNIITVPKKGNTTTIAIFTPSGAYYEPNEIKGISHFIEHLLFKGTGKRTANEIAEGIEQYGGDLNAYTDWDVTCYWAKIANKYSKKALDIVCDLVTNPIFPEKEIDKERQVIIQELKMYEDNPAYHVEDLFNRYFFNNTSGFHLPIVGTNESLKNINRQKIIDYYTKNYSNLCLVVVGEVDKEKRTIVSENNIIPIYASTLTKHKEKLITKKDIQQSNVIIGNYFNPSNLINDIYSFHLMTCIYNDMSGRLFKTIREKNNLVYRIHFNFNTFNNTIFWEVALGLDKNKIDKAYNLIIKELTRPFIKKEIQMGIQKFIGETEMYQDSSKNILNKIVLANTLDLDYKEFIYSYERNIKKASKNINEYIKKINFKNNLLVGLTPE